MSGTHLMRQRTKQFDFDHWRMLAEKDPEAFEAMRREAIENFMDGLPREEVRERMHKLQWRIDQERHRSDNPLGACIRLYNMMWRSVGHNYDLIQTLSGPSGEIQQADNGLAKAQVVNFPSSTGTDDR